MSNDERFDIANLKQDLAISNICVNSEEVELLKNYYKEISIIEMINLIKKHYIE